MISVSLVFSCCMVLNVFSIDYFLPDYWPENGEVYYIRNVKSGRYMDLYGTPANNANVGLWHGHKGTNQQWGIRRCTAYSESAHVYEIYSIANPNYFLTIKNGSSLSGAELVVTYNSNSVAPVASRFLIDPERCYTTGSTWKETGWFRIFSYSSSVSMTLCGENGGISDGTYIVQSNDTTSTSQFWYFEKVSTSNSTKTLSANLVDSGKHLDVKVGGSYQNLVRDAFDIWNSYKPGVIREYPTYSGSDVSVWDAAETGTAGSYWLGVTNFADATIKMNTTVLNYFNNNEFIKKTIAHELGHALGIDHWNDYLYLSDANIADVMVSGPLKTAGFLGYRDKASYDLVYSTY